MKRPTMEMSEEGRAGRRNTVPPFAQWRLAARRLDCSAFGTIARAHALVVLALTAGPAAVDAAPNRPLDRRLATYANPIDLPYRYQPRTRGASYREAADPTIVRF